MNSAHLGGDWFVNVFYNIKYSTINIIYKNEVIMNARVKVLMTCK